MGQTPPFVKLWKFILSPKSSYKNITKVYKQGERSGGMEKKGVAMSRSNNFRPTLRDRLIFFCDYYRDVIPEFFDFHLRRLYYVGRYVFYGEKIACYRCNSWFVPRMAIALCYNCWEENRKSWPKSRFHLNLLQISSILSQLGPMVGSSVSVSALFIEIIVPISKKFGGK